MKPILLLQTANYRIVKRENPYIKSNPPTYTFFLEIKKINALNEEYFTYLTNLEDIDDFLKEIEFKL